MASDRAVKVDEIEVCPICAAFVWIESKERHAEWHRKEGHRA